MIYEYDLVVPANTLASAPATLEMPLSRGIVVQFSAQFPGGCHGAVVVVVRRALHQVWPSNPDGQLKADAHVIVSPEGYELLEPPFQLEAYGWSPGTTYQHTITLRFALQTPEQLQPTTRSDTIIDRLGALILGRRL